MTAGRVDQQEARDSAPAGAGQAAGNGGGGQADPGQSGGGQTGPGQTGGGQTGGGWIADALREHDEARLDEARLDGAPGQEPETGHPHRPGGRRRLPIADREQQVLDRIDRARRRRPRVREERITMSHGAGGKATQTLIEAVFLDAFRNPVLEALEDAAHLRISGARLALTTDSFVVSPLFFPGGDIGDLAVNGTVNDLAVSGATPLYLTAGFILEEGFPVADLTRITASMAAAATAAGVQIVTGDTKVVERGKADGCYISTAGVGLIEGEVDLGVASAEPGDAILVSGPIGDHGVTIMLARGELDIEADLESDTAPLNGLVASLLAASPGVRALRDATRGGVATILNEIAKAADVGVLVTEADIPVREEVRGASELLGIDPMYVACEGRLVAVVDGSHADQALAAMRGHPAGQQAAVIGRVTGDNPGIVQLKTAFGGTRIVDLLVGDPLPRIC
jgi:hydrogenase expression/formation protein HypE